MAKKSENTAEHQSPEQLHEQGVLSDLDLHFGRFMERLAERPVPGLALAAALVSSTTREGHICLDLSSQELPVTFPATLRRELGRSGVVGKPGEYTPLILDKRGRLYLYRYWGYEAGLSSWIKARVKESDKPLDAPRLRERLGRLFPGEDMADVDWQKVAAFIAARKGFAVLSGGPGTGKTTTAAKILALLIEQAQPQPLRIGLAAPTGKGAARLQEAILRSSAVLPCGEGVKEAMPVEAFTLHRLLGPVEGSPYFRHNAQNPLALEVVVVDEASMVDLALMSKLVEALPEGCRLILLGDKDQLASVEAGAVLGDICDTGRTHGYSRKFCRQLREATYYHLEPESGKRGVTPLTDCVAHLSRSYRFGPGSGISALSRAVNQGDGALSLGLMKEGGYGDIRWRTLPSIKALARNLREGVLAGFGDVFRSGHAGEVHAVLDRFRVLCALREGPFGVHAVNRMVEELLRREGLIRGEGRWYPGRPVLITRNDYELRLFNGDVGVTLPDPATSGELRVFFGGGAGEMRSFHPLRLPEHETVYAMTVHKSQGSEFDRVLLLLPDRDSPVLTRELIYTAVTRAREAVEVWGVEEVFCSSLSRRIERHSGLREALWGI
ncbi:MAG: exodeoxyribonuclease V subunit alpha [Thermodesulfobacteriota bacterium]